MTRCSQSSTAHAHVNGTGVCCVLMFSVTGGTDSVVVLPQAALSKTLCIVLQLLDASQTSLLSYGGGNTG